MALINKQDILAALHRLGQLAQEQGEHVELVLVGGAAKLPMMWMQRFYGHAKPAKFASLPRVSL